MGALIQCVYDLRRKVYCGQITSGILRRMILRAAVVICARAGDPGVNYEFSGRTIVLPFSHELPRIWCVYRDYSFNLARLASACVEKHPDATMVDVGANVGDSVAIVRTTSSLPVLCVEGNPTYLKYLTRNLLKFEDTEVEPRFVGAEDQDSRGRVISNGGTAHLELSGSDASMLSIRTLETIVSTHPRFTAPRLVKIDTDGYDQRIIMGSEAFLRSANPCIFFEYDPYFLAMQSDDGLSLFPFLESLGYSGAVIWDNFGVFLLSTQLSEKALFEQLHLYYSGRRSSAYMDIAVFHSTDQDLFEAVVLNEMQNRERIIAELPDQDLSKGVR